MSARAAMGASAPGKLMVAGEYAVLHGSVAVVAAVGRRAVARWSPWPDGSGAVPGGSRGSAHPPPEVVLARRLAEQRFGAMDGELSVDVSELRSGGRKLGLGSSAAAASAAVGAVLARAGQSLAREEVRRTALDLALEGHRAVAPLGSGADVAASVLGGLLVFQREAGRVDAQPVAPPASIDVRVTWTGRVARTSELVAQVSRLRGRDEAAHDAAIARIAEAATRLALAIARDDAPAAIEACAAHHDAMAALGVAASAPIVEERLAAVAVLARAHGGAAKPSGAGGGDVAIAFFDRRRDGADAFDAEIERAGMAPIVVPLYAEGLREEPTEGTTP